MKQKIMRNQNRFWIVINIVSLLFILVLFYTGKSLQWPIIMIIFEIGLCALFVLSFFHALIRTKLWKFVHSDENKLDEREIQVVLKSLKYSYSVFTILCIVIFYSIAVMEQGPVDVLMAGALLYLAHTIPAFIVGWQESQ
jgi:hypothetical protein